MAATRTNTAVESAQSVVYVYNRPDRGEIGDYVWFDENADGLQNEVEYADYTFVQDMTRKLPRRVPETGPDGQTIYKPAWGDGEQRQCGRCMTA